MSVLDAFKAADQVLLSGVQGITDLITTPGLINLDFADVKSVMSGAGSALMGTGSSRGDDRAVAAAEMAISSPLLEASIDGAHGVLLSIQGGSDLGLFEINEAAQLVSNSAAVDANIIFGAVIDDALGDEVRVTVIAAGLDENRAGRTGGGTSASSAESGGTAFSSTSSFGGLGSGAGSASSAPVSRARLRPPPRPPPRPLRPRLRRPAAGPATRCPDHPRTPGSGWAAKTADPPRSRRPATSACSARRCRRTRPGREPPAPSRPATIRPRPRMPPIRRPRTPRSPARRTPSWARPSTSPATRRRPVVFEEDDDLDVPDFLK